MSKAVHKIYCIAGCLLYNVTEAEVRLGGSDFCCAAGLAVFVAAEALPYQYQLHLNMIQTSIGAN